MFIDAFILGPIPFSFCLTTTCLRMSSSEEKVSSPPIKRRRSSILRRKSIVPVSSEHTHELALREYIADLRREKTEWGDICRQRKSQQKISEEALAQISAEPPTVTFDTFKQDLTDEDLKNIQQPDYDEICNDVYSFVRAASIAKTRLDRVNSSIDTNLMHLKSHINALSKSICNFNDCAPLWQKTQDTKNMKVP